MLLDHHTHRGHEQPTVASFVGWTWLGAAIGSMLAWGLIATEWSRSGENSVTRLLAVYGLALCVVVGFAMTVVGARFRRLPDAREAARWAGLGLGGGAIFGLVVSGAFAFAAGFSLTFAVLSLSILLVITSCHAGVVLAGRAWVTDGRRIANPR